MVDDPARQVFKAGLENQEREEKVQHLFLWECLEREKEEKGKVKRDALFSSIIYTNGE